MEPISQREDLGAMRPLAGEALLAAWERASSQPPMARALTLLLTGFPGVAERHAAAMSVAKRDLALLCLHSGSFGALLSGFSVCPSCGERLEFALPDAPLAATLRSAAEIRRAVTHGGCTIQLRLANSIDIAAAAAKPDVDVARSSLLACCLEATDAEGATIPFAVVPEAARLEALAQLQAMHGAAELSISLSCPACEAQETVLLDVASFLWAQVQHAARLLLDDVHELAWAYGWAEQAILAMSAARRQGYLERLRS
jgi:hypothetical protein